jgi:hypothetical protein
MKLVARADDKQNLSRLRDAYAAEVYSENFRMRTRPEEQPITRVVKLEKLSNSIDDIQSESYTAWPL